MGELWKVMIGELRSQARKGYLEGITLDIFRCINLKQYVLKIAIQLNFVYCGMRWVDSPETPNPHKPSVADKVPASLRGKISILTGLLSGFEISPQAP